MISSFILTLLNPYSGFRPKEKLQSQLIFISLSEMASSCQLGVFSSWHPIIHEVDPPAYLNSKAQLVVFLLQGMEERHSKEITSSANQSQLFFLELTHSLLPQSLTAWVV